MRRCLVFIPRSIYTMAWVTVCIPEIFYNKPISHIPPLYPGMHEHWNLLLPSTQVPPFRHGLLEHSLISDQNVTGWLVWPWKVSQRNEIFPHVIEWNHFFLNSHRVRACYWGPAYLNIISEQYAIEKPRSVSIPRRFSCTQTCPWQFWCVWFEPATKLPMRWKASNVKPNPGKANRGTACSFANQEYY